MLRLLLALILIGCGTNERLVNAPFYINLSKVDVEVLPYVMEFAGYCEKFNTEKKCAKNFKRIKSIKVVDYIEENAIGMCSTWTSGDREIKILKNYADLDSNIMRQVVMHELGHCVLGSGSEQLPHYDYNTDIMNSQALPETILFAEWPKLIKAMFKRAGGNFSLTDTEEVATVTKTVMDSSGGIACETRKN